MMQNLDKLGTICVYTCLRHCNDGISILGEVSLIICGVPVAYSYHLQEGD